MQVGSRVARGVVSAALFRRLLLLNLLRSVSGMAAPARVSQVRSRSEEGVTIIDSHLHVWANSDESVAFPYTQDPPNHLQDLASMDALIDQMNRGGVHGALIVQPINHGFDHTYVRRALEQHPDRFKGMLLLDPSLSVNDATSLVRTVVANGFVGVRFNPYLWPQLSTDDDQKEGGAPVRFAPMSEGVGRAVYALCGELHIPVGIMCFRGLSQHVDDIATLIESSPATTLILDHYGFTALFDDKESSNHHNAEHGSDETPAPFQQLLNLARKYPQMVIKASAPFRLNDPAGWPFDRVRTERFTPLLQAVGAQRLLFGSDFPYVLDHTGPQEYGRIVALLSSWIEDEGDRRAILGGNAQRLFGPWGGTSSNDEL